MKAFFSGKIRVATMTPMWLEKDQIGEWLAGKKAAEKSRRKQNKQEQPVALGKRKQTPPTTTKQVRKAEPVAAGPQYESSGESGSSSHGESPFESSGEEDSS
jgi:hypothetical protein